MLDGDLFELLNILRGVPQGYRSSSTLFQVFTDDMLKVVEAIGPGVNVGESQVSALLFADDFVGMCDTPEGLQQQIGIGMEFARR